MTPREPGPSHEASARTALPGAGSATLAAGITAPLLLALLLLICLTPFAGKAFHIDDTLFVWTARHIAANPQNPFGFEVTWYKFPQTMSEVTQNPPLAAYYLAVAGAALGWSEYALHAAFLLPALAAALGCFVLARRLTGRPLLAALATLLSPGFLVSGTDVMCDIMMLAWFILAILAWLEGLERNQPVFLAVSGLLITASMLTKYFGIALIPLLLLYTLIRLRRPGLWIAWLLAPLVILEGYEYWTKSLYGMGLFASASQYASSRDLISAAGVSGVLYHAVAGLSFTGGCALPALAFAPLLWSRRQILLGLSAGGVAGFLWGMGFCELPTAHSIAPDYRAFLSLQLALYIAGGISVLGLTLADWRRHRDHGSVLLLLWVAGTFVFAAFLNWTVNARSVLPLIPAVAILLARRIETRAAAAGSLPRIKLAAILAATGAVSFWVAWGDTSLANSARAAAQAVHDRLNAPNRLNPPAGTIFFAGHWGFQYYMEAFGAQPAHPEGFEFKTGDWLIVPHNNTNLLLPPSTSVASQQDLKFPIRSGVATMSTSLGAGFYSDVWGPLPFAFGNVPPETYTVYRLRASR